MAKDPESRPITVEDLIARTVPEDEAFPRDEAAAVRRPSRRRGGKDSASPTTASGPTASGMPGYTPPAPEPSPARIIGASGMPDYSPSTPRKTESANVVTGIIPVVTDDDETEATAPGTGGLRAVDPDDLIGVDLPTGEQPLPEVTVVSADSSLPSATVFTGDAAYTQEPTAFVALDEDTAAAVDALDQTEPAVGDHLASTGELTAAQDAADAAVPETEPAGKVRSPLWGWLGLAGEVVLGLAIGAGLFWGFTVLWKQYVYLALILAVLVIFAIVTFSYVLRKRDLATTLLALAVGLLVTIGPLVLLV
ncbi:hypothetical protein GOHSU_14_00340 [Gordonia hirsuta DSM 44140 = NBRC 16056]|uniref:Transmembrane protein n=1 Tax=Gordonia hirsuta DSM 44140 = NBRC 16056 TaxID=1121927 RepID=L7L9Y7_9ACTN|nr:hypothetical protein [Gordonia hirsuta]GAC56867.1 hypothetical protein GOHSU_14_00340 [Gordonia hirsuta DSM 44140 = NBRC 16056]